MITKEMISEAYINRIVKRDVNIIYQTQQEVVAENLKSQTGTLASHLIQRPFELENMGSKQVYYMRTLPYLRFLDMSVVTMRTRRKLALYNRVIWGVLYHETLPAIRYGLTQDIRDSIGAELQAAADYEKNNNW